MTAIDSSLTDALRGRYVIERELGRGGMATVYLARDEKHDRPVALKLLHRELAALGPERFLREIRLTARLDHPHTLPVLDSGEAAGRLWYTMPYVEGESLRDRLRREPQLPVSEALTIAREVADALEYAHSHGVVHRDIKPENILLAHGHARVADFGVARALEVAGGEQLTGTGLTVGTPTYMSPEQATGGQVDARSDIYALGCVLHEMLAGEPPFTGPTPQAVVAKRFIQPPPALRQLRAAVPEAVEGTVRRALANAPVDRFATAAEFARALDAPTASPASRRVSRVMLLGLGLAVVSAAAAIFLWRERAPVPAPNANLLAIAPFDVLSPGFEIWREGVADLLARDLDGAGPLHTVSPTIVIRRWDGRADRASAEALARGTGAGTIVYGALVGTGGDSVRLTASILDATSREIIGEADLRGSAERMDHLADSLAVRVLRELGRTRPIGAARLGALSSRSLPALRAFLRGEQALRRAEWDEARSHYEEAATRDTTFALAYWRLGVVRLGQFGTEPNDSLARAYFVRAAGLSRGLPPRESLLVVTDSLMSTLSAALTPASDVGPVLQRLFDTAELVTRRYPMDPEAWVALGEVRYHFGYGLGVGPEMRLAPFSRAVALDSAYAPAYTHAISSSLAVDDQAAARRYIAGHLALRPGRDVAQNSRTIVRLLDAEPTDRMEELLDTLPVASLILVWANFMLAPDSQEIAIRLARALSARRVTDGAWYDDLAVRRGLLAASLLFRGHLREARDVVGAHQDELAGWGLYTELAFAGVVPPDSANRFFRGHLQRAGALPPALRFAPPWWASRGDTAALLEYIKRFRRPQDPDGGSGAGADRYWLAPMTDPYWLAAGEAYLALARRDTTEALRRLVALPDSLGTVWFERLTWARLLSARGATREALMVLDRGFPYPYPVGSHGLWARERARLAEQLRDGEQARQWYGYLVRLWRHGDPELRRYSDSVRVAPARIERRAGH